jgi:hypothetical protein
MSDCDHEHKQLIDEQWDGEMHVHYWACADCDTKFIEEFESNGLEQYDW